MPVIAAIEESEDTDMAPYSGYVVEWQKPWAVSSGRFAEAVLQKCFHVKGLDWAVSHVPPDLVFWFLRSYCASMRHGSWHRVGLHLCWSSSKDGAHHCTFPLLDSSNSLPKPYFKLLWSFLHRWQASWLGSEQGSLMWGVLRGIESHPCLLLQPQ